MLQPSPHPRKTIQRRSSASQTHAAYPFPSPQRGLDTASPMPGGNPLTAVRLENFIPRSLGCQMRRGYRRWVSNLAGEVRTLMQFRPATAPPKMLAATSTGAIYDVTFNTVSSFTPTALLTVAGGQPNGEWTTLNFVTSAGVHRLVMVNPGTGYWLYDGTTFLHVTMGADPATQVSGVDPNTFVHVTVFKNRLWFVQANTTRAWYLPLGQFAGVASEFDFGAMLPQGGALDTLINWTYDGGGPVSGGGTVNNQLVVVSNQGDVLIYGGDDPDDPSLFQSVQGRWFVGRVPTGRRYFSMYMSDVIILSDRGMCFMSEVMRGQGFFQNVQTAAAINSSLAAEIAESLDTRYWEVVFLPHEQLLVLNRAEINTENLQWAYEVNSKAFSILRGVPMNTVMQFDGRTFCGDLLGNIWWCFEGNSDGAVDATPGSDLQGVVVSSFQALGDGVRLKRFLMVRPSFISSSAPGIQARLNSEWDLGVEQGVPAYLGAGENFWDVGQWNVAVWSGQGRSYEAWQGANGTGRYGALSMRVRGAADTVFIGWQALVEAGGIL